MTEYLHGIRITEKEPDVPLTLAGSGIQVVIGTAPIHLADDPKAAVNQIIVAHKMEDVQKKLGYNEDFEHFTLNQAAYLAFKFVKVAPIVCINVLDPTKHSKAGTKLLTLTEKGVVIPVDNVLLSSVVVKNEDNSTTFVKDVDYTIAYNEANQPVVNAISTSSNLTTTSKINVEYNELDPSEVTANDIIGGYDVGTGIATGIELVRKVYPQYSIRPEIILAPGYSSNPVVGAVLQAKNANINDSFNGKSFLDADTETVRKYEDVATWKEENYYTDKRAVVCWPKVKIGEHIFHYSALLAAVASRMCAEDDDGIPYKSPSNKKLNIDATVLADGTPVFLEKSEANYLNKNGIVTILNWAGDLRSWGNNTAAYPTLTRPQDRFIAIRSVFDWWGNTFVESFFDKVDDPTDFKLIEYIVDSENIRANSFTSRGKIAGAKIEFNKEDNPIEDILNGKIKFKQKIGAFAPAEDIENELEFDPTLVEAAIYGGEE